MYYTLNKDKERENGRGSQGKINYEDLEQVPFEELINFIG